MTVDERSSRRRQGWYWLLIIPFIATLWPPFYAHEQPVVAGFPFLYWYLLLWIVLVAVVSAIVFAITG
jgi:hypothetical protein